MSAKRRSDSIETKQAALDFLRIHNVEETDRTFTADTKLSLKNLRKRIPQFPIIQKSERNLR